MERNTLNGAPPSDGFWETMRQQRETRETNTETFQPQRTFNTPNRKPISTQSQALSSASLSEEAKELKVGDVIEHERFGRGEVVSLEQEGGNRRAFVNFESAGQKQLLLKYAKFKKLH